MPFLSLSHLQKSFGASRVVRDFSLGIGKGEFVSLLGPSGCGKTTVLRMVAGFEQPDSGSIRIDGAEVTAVKTSERNIGMVFQAYALFPNLTVAGNVGFGLRVKGAPRAEIDQRVSEMLKLIGLPDHGNRYPYQLSGGQQQRVALARALAPLPRVLLLDEPLSALDAKIRVSLRNEIRDIQRKLGITTIFVTHDQEEALSISDRVVVMNGGVAEQCGTPFEIYNQPATRFVASFVGTLNVLETRVVEAATGRLRVGDSELVLGRPVTPAADGSLALGLRPEQLHLGESRNGEAMLKARVEEVHFMGSVIRLSATVEGQRLAIDMFNRHDLPPPRAGHETFVRFAPGQAIVLSA